MGRRLIGLREGEEVACGGGDDDVGGAAAMRCDAMRCDGAAELAETERRSLRAASNRARGTQRQKLEKGEKA